MFRYVRRTCEQPRSVWCKVVAPRKTDLPKIMNSSTAVKDLVSGNVEHESLDTLADGDLWSRILEEDNRAWKSLVLRYRKLVYATLISFQLSLPDAADCFQQTWVLLYQNRRSLKDPTRLSSWLITTAKREALRLKRRSARFDYGDTSPDTPDQAPLPDEALCRLELQAHLEIALAHLDERCKRLVTLFFFAPEERSYDEIAHTLGLAPNTLGPLRRRCLERLKFRLSQCGFLDERNGD
jgi:RNA polymerase sigma factor (sigma-70 family)